MSRRDGRRVRYVSPFCAPAVLDKDRAERYLTEDARLWSLLEKSGFLSARLRGFGPPRIEQARG